MYEEEEKEKNSEFSSVNPSKKKDWKSKENYITVRFVFLVVLLISLKKWNKKNRGINL